LAIEAHNDLVRLLHQIIFRSHATALAALTAAGVTWGLTVPLSKLALEWLGPAWLTVGRFGVAAPLLALVARRRLPATLRPAVVGWGALGYGTVILVQNAGIERTSVSHAALIVGVVPVLVALLAVALGRGRTGPLAWLGFTLALAGVGLVAGGGGGNASAAGDGLVLFSVALSAAAVTAQPRLLAGRDAIAVTAVQLGAGALVALPAALALEGLPTAPPAGGWALPATVLLATAGTLLPFTLFAYGQARIAPQLAGAFLNLEPLVGALAGAAAFGDAFGPVQLAGGLVLLAGIALSAIPRPAPARGFERHRGTERIRPGGRASFTRRSDSLLPAGSSRRMASGRPRPRSRADPESRGPTGRVSAVTRRSSGCAVGTNSRQHSWVRVGSTVAPDRRPLDRRSG
jgi:drug/metabolite transporter (DMT)-like permease